jgi:hypothetical protein
MHRSTQARDMNLGVGHAREKKLIAVGTSHIEPKLPPFIAA